MNAVLIGIAITVGSGMILYILKWFTDFATKAIAILVVDKIGDGLVERRAMERRRALDPLKSDIEANKSAIETIAQDVSEIKAEVTVNGGGSLKDRVIEMGRTLEVIVTEARGG